MEREVVRVVTPGTITDEALLEERRDTVLASVFGQGDRYGLAWLDLSAGRFSVMELDNLTALETEVERLRPAEILAPDGAQPVLARSQSGDERTWRGRAPWHFEIASATRALTEQFRTRDLSGFGCADKPLAIAAAGALRRASSLNRPMIGPNVGGSPEQAQSDGAGHVYIDLEDKDSIAVVDAKEMKMTGKYDLAGKGGGPGGLGLDAKNNIYYMKYLDGVLYNY